MIRAALEYNDFGCLLYAMDYIGCYARGVDCKECIKKLYKDVTCYCAWLGLAIPVPEVVIVQCCKSECRIHEADTEILLESEVGHMTMDDYEKKKKIALTSATAFHEMYQSIPKKIFSDIPIRKTFYGLVPRSAKEMYEHTNGVSDYYMHEVHVRMENQNNIIESRKEAFYQLEKKEDFLRNEIFIGKGGEVWNVSKMLRRFVWHDRIHAKAMYRLGVRKWGSEIIANTFSFTTE